jgi:hypothetical protein
MTALGLIHCRTNAREVIALQLPTHEDPNDGPQEEAANERDDKSCQGLVLSKGASY